MNRERLLHIVLAVVGIGALTAYLVACRPSWSPDGSKVLFPYLDPGAKQAGIALFDKNTGKTRSIFSKPAAVGSADAASSWPWAQWDRKGERAIVVWNEKRQGKPDEFHVHVLRIGAEKPDRTFVVPHVNVCPGIPLPEANGSLFVGGEALVRMDLQTGAVERRELQDMEDVVLVGHEDRIHYCTQSGDPKPAYEIGTVDPKKLVLRPGLKLRSEDVGEIFPLITVAKDGSAIAILSEKEKKCQLLIVAGDKLQKSIPLELSTETHKLGNLQWSPDGKTIYSALVARIKDQKGFELGVAEITVKTGAIRVTRLLRGRWEDVDIEILPLFFQVALSPDGKTIAAAPTCFLGKLEDEKDRALHLVDLTSPDRKVTKIPVPVPQGPKK